MTQRGSTRRHPPTQSFFFVDIRNSNLKPLSHQDLSQYSEYHYQRWVTPFAILLDFVISPETSDPFDNL